MGGGRCTRDEESKNLKTRAIQTKNLLQNQTSMLTIRYLRARDVAFTWRARRIPSQLRRGIQGPGQKRRSALCAAAQANRHVPEPWRCIVKEPVKTVQGHDAGRVFDEVETVVAQALGLAAPH